MREIKYGGQIVPGDFIAISDGNHLNFGWYAGNGRGTLQYYPVRGAMRCYQDYESWLNMSDADKAKNKYYSKRFEKGFTVKCLWKSFINSVHKTRVMKLTNVEDIFTEQEDIKEYQQSREVMIKLNLVKQ
jgi:CO dehydrogenase/acetyl-CoA synthase beta subunit